MARILIVDDEKSIRRTLAEFLRAEGYAVDEAEDADAAQRCLQSAEYDVVVTDIILPRVTGVELLRRIQATAPRVQVVMMTGEPTLETVTESLRAGAADYLAKPIGKSAILRTVGNTVRLKRLDDERRRLEAENQAHRENLERLVAERTAQLRASEDRYRGLVETTFDWVWEVDTQGRYTYASPRLRELLGYEPAEVLGRTPFDLMPEAEAARVRARFEQIVAERRPFALLENTNRHRDGRLVVVETSGVPVFAPDGSWAGYHGMDRDVTARREAEMMLRLRGSALEAAANSIVITDRDGTIEWANPTFCRQNGWGLAEVVGRSHRELMKSGVHDDAYFAEMWRTIAAGLVWRGEVVNRRRDGELRTEELTITSLRDARGEISHYIAIGQDVTERRRMDDQLRESLREREALLKEVHHRVKNNLQVISSLLRLEAGQVESAPARAVLGDLQNRVRAMALLHEDLYRSANLANIDLAAYLHEICRHLVVSGFPERAGGVDLQADLQPVQVGANQALPCGLLVNELVSNCVKHAFPGGRRGVVQVTLRPADNAGEWCLTVADDGVGLPPDFTLDDQRTLGLQLVGDLVAQLGGRIAYRTGAGARFTITFPPHGEAALIP